MGMDTSEQTYLGCSRLAGDTRDSVQALEANPNRTNLYFRRGCRVFALIGEAIHPRPVNLIEDYLNIQKSSVTNTLNFLVKLPLLWHPLTSANSGNVFPI